MRRSLLRHPLAVLRQIIDVNSAKLAQLCGCSMSTIQSVEMGRMPLSEKLAARIAGETGVSVEWLLDGNPEVPPKTMIFEELSPQSFWKNDEYSKKSFEWYRALLATAGCETLANESSRPRECLSDGLQNLRAMEWQAEFGETELRHLCNAYLEEVRRVPEPFVAHWRLKQFLKKELANQKLREKKPAKRPSPKCPPNRRIR